MNIKKLRGPGDEVLTHEAWRLHVARLLMWMSAKLTRGAISVGGFKRRRCAPHVEFYAEAGAPEGALFVDGERVGTIQRREKAVITVPIRGLA